MNLTKALVLACYTATDDLQFDSEHRAYQEALKPLLVDGFKKAFLFMLEDREGVMLSKDDDCEVKVGNEYFVIEYPFNEGYTATYDDMDFANVSDRVALV